MSKSTFNLFGEIVADDSQRWFDSDVTPAMVVGWLAKQDGDLEFNINSPGGDVSGGLAIANAIKSYGKGKITANVLGIAASMASVIACAADEIKMGKGAFFMIHNPWTFSMGDADDLRKEAETLDKMRDSLIGFYQTKNSKTADEIKAFMDAESWIADTEMEAFGFASSPFDGDVKAAASLTRRQFAKAPDAARAFMEFHAERPGNWDRGTGNAQTVATATPPSNHATDWEARYKGMQAAKDKEIAALKAAKADSEKKALELMAASEAEFKAKIEGLNSQISNLQADVDAKSKALEVASGDIKQLETKCAETDKALAETQAALKVAEDRYRAQVGSAMQQPEAPKLKGAAAVAASIKIVK